MNHGSEDLVQTKEVVCVMETPHMEGYREKDRDKLEPGLNITFKAYT